MIMKYSNRIFKLMYVSYCAIFFALTFQLTNSNDNAIDSCKDIIKIYNQVGYPVRDCLVQNSEPLFPLLFWRVDVAVPYITARAACRLVQFGDLATVHSSYDQKILNDLFIGKMNLNSWMWIGGTNVGGTFMWNDAFEVPAVRFYPNSTSKTEGDCLVMFVTGDPQGENDLAGTFYYSQDCFAYNIPVCFTSGNQLFPFKK